MAAMLLGDCPRCGHSHVTFSVPFALATNEEDGKNTWEALCVCRACLRTVVFELKGKGPSGNHGSKHGMGLIKQDALVNSSAEIVRAIAVTDFSSTPIPEHLPADVHAVMDEANKCVAAKLFNAAGAMYRLAIDLATAPLLPPDQEAEPNRKTRRDLGLRVPWLIENGKLDRGLAGLAKCIREDGNDAAHRGILTQNDTEDLQDFATELFRRMFTEPKRLELAEARRVERRGGSSTQP